MHRTGKLFETGNNFFESCAQDLDLFVTRSNFASAVLAFVAPRTAAVVLRTDGLGGSRTDLWQLVELLDIGGVDVHLQRVLGFSASTSSSEAL